MLSKPESACFVIADISGYTSFLHGAELDHALKVVEGAADKHRERRGHLVSVANRTRLDGAAGAISN